MNLKHIAAVLLSFSLALPVSAAPVVPHPFPGVEGQSDALTVAAKRKKKKQHVRRNPRNGDVLLGRVGSSRPQRGRRARQAQANDAALGALLGAALVGAMVGGASSGRSGGMPSRSGSHGRSSGGGGGGGNIPTGDKCGVQYWTDTPTSPTC
jgi:hypothetical protein